MFQIPLGIIRTHVFESFDLRKNKNISLEGTSFKQHGEVKVRHLLTTLMKYM